jgi:hypothetical protein
MGGKYEAAEPFVAKWRETHPGYVSPYASDDNRRLQSEERRLLEGTRATTMPSAIIVTTPG